ncbi:MAG: hypothetical protein LUQ09_04755 [Methanomassiliicoccales archaeon]|nr:hypothetical protein [Methanomassiliicoccales archaeon]
MTKDITACQYCGSRRISPKVLVGGPMAQLDDKDGSYVCQDCGRTLVPLNFTGENDRKSFQSVAVETSDDFLMVPIIPVDTWSLYDLQVTEIPLTDVTKVAEINWRNGWDIAPGDASFHTYWKVAGSKSYGSGNALLMDMAGLQRARPHFEALKVLMKRKNFIWLEMGVRDVQDLFDAFTIGSQNVIVGSMTCSSRDLLEEIVELSDQSVPMLYFDGNVLWGSKRFGPASAKESLDMLYDIGFDRAAVLDLRHLGGEGFDAELAADVLSSEIEVIIGGGVRETDVPALKKMGAAGCLLDPYTPGINEMMAAQPSDGDDQGA